MVYDILELTPLEVVSASTLHSDFNSHCTSCVEIKVCVCEIRGLLLLPL